MFQLKLKTFKTIRRLLIKKREKSASHDIILCDALFSRVDGQCQGSVSRVGVSLSPLKMTPTLDYATHFSLGSRVSVKGRCHSEKRQRPLTMTPKNWPWPPTPTPTLTSDPNKLPPLSRSYLNSQKVKENHSVTFRCPRWRHQDQRSPPPHLNFRFLNHSKIDTFEAPYLSQLFVRFVWLLTFDLAHKNLGISGRAVLL